MKKEGFTLIELLVVITIIGLLSSIVATSFTSAVSKAQAAYEVNIGHAVVKAFTLKALDDNITTWWDEDDFPSSLSWGAYIGDIIEQGAIEEFLPIIINESNYGGNGAELPYAYDNDGDVFVNPANCYSGGQSNSYRGVNFVYNLGIGPGNKKWERITEYMDQALDKTDGPFCGRFRYATTGSPSARGQLIYSIDFDQKPNF